MRIPATDSAFDQPIDTKEFENAREKAGIGKLAASLIEDGDTILIDSGTTTLEIVKNLHRFKHLTIVTNAINIAIEALKYERFPVILLGGHLRLSSQSVVGPIAESNIKSFYCDKLFLGVDSFNITAGISTPNLEEANLNQFRAHLCRTGTHRHSIGQELPVQATLRNQVPRGCASHRESGKLTRRRRMYGLRTGDIKHERMTKTVSVIPMAFIEQCRFMLVAIPAIIELVN